ncbi:MAG: D-2-hydroxyacid dehydrogenase [Chloroflexi bacterium]|nr:D-2-hydroxyacid dehydrogenase [Chloroflexota bacterium]MYB42131.1 D-2-hydroxyacid dehydrogenase [Chloroflexota bacterium]
MNILIVTGTALPEVPDEIIERIMEAAGPDSTVTVVDSDGEALEFAAETDVVLGFVTPQLHAAAPNLRWVHAIASGVNRYLYPAFRDGEVMLSSEKGQVGPQLADHAFALLLALTRKVGSAIRLGPEAWDQRRALRMQETELTGKVMGIVGYGGTGRAVAQRATGFGMRSIAVDRDALEGDDHVEAVWAMDRFNELLEASDVVAVCCPLTPETHDLFDREAFARMPRGSMIVNVTRGEIIDADALIEALDSGQLAGAGLDVVPIEPLPEDHPLWQRDDVVMTPHAAGASQLRASKNIDRFCRNLRRLRNGEPIEGLIDKQTGY